MYKFKYIEVLFYNKKSLFKIIFISLKLSYYMFYGWNGVRVMVRYIITYFRTYVLYGDVGANVIFLGWNGVFRMKLFKFTVFEMIKYYLSKTSLKMHDHHMATL
jgi:hypothetical protein